MKFCGCINIDCSHCIEYSVAYCPPSIINIPVNNLTTGTTYFLWVIDKFKNVYTTATTGKSDGSFDVLQSDFPVGLFANGFGKRDIYLTTDVYGYNVKPLTYNGITANCLILSVQKKVTTPATGCPKYVPDCSSCFEYSSPYCSNINIPATNLTNGTTYYLWVVDKFNRIYSGTTIGNPDGSFNINQADFTPGLFSSGNGSLDAFLTTDQPGQNVKQLIFAGVTYNCSMVSVSGPLALADNCFVLCDNGIILIDG